MTDLVENKQEFVGIKNPRIVQVDHKNSALPLSKMIGEPNELMFVDKKPVFYYDMVDKRVIDLYTESVSGIKVARQMPNNLSVIK